MHLQKETKFTTQLNIPIIEMLELVLVLTEVVVVVTVIAIINNVHRMLLLSLSIILPNYFRILI